MKNTSSAARQIDGDPGDPGVTVERYKGGRHWAVYDRAGLVAVTVYRKGAFAVAERIGRPYVPPKGATRCRS